MGTVRTLVIVLTCGSLCGCANGFAAQGDAPVGQADERLSGTTVDTTTL